MHRNHLRLVHSRPIHRCSAAYVFDLYELMHFAELLEGKQIIHKEADDVEPCRLIIAEAWQRYLEETLWDYGINVVRTARFHDQTYAYVRYLKWKLDHTPLIRGLIPWRELNATHGPDQCYVYIRDDAMLLAYY